ncbi:MAG: FAD synthetase family protein, partial [Thermomicrobiaceae bacterium]|nr:FAD synthetase family protein [Thermomicrobiaceae bacterium]
MPVTVVESLDETPPGPHAVTIGNFDGVHRGHQALLARTVAAARERGARSLVVTFEPLPLYVLRPEAAPKRLTTNQERIAALAAYGIDDIVVLRFDRALAELSAHEFVARLVAGTHPVEVVVGEDFAFGHNRAGTPDLLRELGKRYGFAVTVV